MADLGRSQLRGVENLGNSPGGQFGAPVVSRPNSLSAPKSVVAGEQGRTSNAPQAPSVLSE